MPEHIQLKILEKEAQIIFDRQESSANVFDSDVMQELNKYLETIESHPQIQRVLILSAKKNIFIAGADINVIQKIDNAQEASQAAELGQQVFNRLANLSATTVACIHGACMGGGLELTLACDIRVATNSSKTRMGLPEVQLGILPAWGGTTRLPRLLSLDKALDLLLSGRMLNGKKAFKMGLVDTCCPQESLKTVARTIAKSSHKKTWQSKLMEWGLVRRFILGQANKGVMKKTRGLYPAPLKILEILKRNPSTNTSFKLETTALGELGTSSECKKLVGLFLSKEAADKDTSWIEKIDQELPSAKNIAVLGAGVMGGGIAHLAAKKNFHTRMRDLNNQGLLAGMQAAHKLCSTELKRRRISKSDARSRLARIVPTLTLEGFNEVDTVIEAVVENLEIKKQVLSEIENKTSPNALIATNSSSLSITEMAKALKKPENFVGIHFFNPVHRMPLIEIIYGEQTSDFTIARAVDLTQKLGKTPVVVKDGPGFLVNRLLAPYMNEALRLVEEGTHPEHIDNALLDYGMPMGPVRLADEIGLDVAAKVGHILSDGLGERMAGPKLVDEMVQQENLGKKNGRGFYQYRGKTSEVALRFGNLRRQHSKQAIQMRVLLPMWNEALRCLEEGIVTNQEKLDLAMILGTGYAPFRGGPLASGHAMGWQKVKEELEQHTQTLGQRFAPTPTIDHLIENPKSFS